MKRIRIHIFTFIPALRNFALLIIPSLSFITGYSQAGEWTWMKGDTIGNSFGNYSVQGVPSPSNAPAARYACGSWTDTAGNFWIYGGVGEATDLCKFDPVTMMWTWMKGDSLYMIEAINAGKGIYDPLNTPGWLGYGMFTWVTPDNHLWLFGGATYYSKIKSNLWQYDPAINEWAWMGNFGPVNYGARGIGTSATMPGGRQEGNCAWTDNTGNLWLFGGGDSLNHSYNDVWKYNVTTGIWTWMSGSSNLNDPGIYDTIGQPSVNSYPAGRLTNLFWKDDADKFWLGGGTQYTNELMFQDIWNFDPQSLKWTWVKGINGEDTSSKGVSCIPDVANKVGPRYENRVNWKICDDLIITSSGFNDWNNNININDLWGYKVSWNEWTKINSWSVWGSFGVRGVASSANCPPYRVGSVGFKDRDNNLWLFGGGLFTASGHSIAFYNDLWKFSMPVCLQTPLSSGINMRVSDSSICHGDTVHVTLGGITNMRIWPATNVFFEDSMHILLFPDSTTQFIITGTSKCRANDTARLLVYVSLPGVFNYSLTATDICRGNSAGLSIFKMTGVTITPSSTVNWLDSTQAILKPDSTTTYLITGSSPACGTADTAAVQIQVTQPLPYTLRITDSVHCAGNHIDTLHTTGLRNVTISPPNHVIWIDSFNAVLSPNGTIPYTVSGFTSCGSAYSEVINFYIPFSMASAYTINKKILCKGDTSILTLLGVKNVIITPAASVARLDSMHYLLYPDTATSYKIKGIVNCTGWLDSVVVPVAVSRPGIINYRIGSTQICNGDGDSLFIYNISNLQLFPHTTVSTTDSLNYRSYFLPPAPAATYTIIGQSGCGTTDTATVTVHSSPYPGFVITPTSICQGDSAAVTVTNLSHIVITPLNNSVTVIDSAHYYLHPQATYSYLISGINCRNNPAQDYFGIQVKPQAPITYTLSDSIICYGSSALLTLLNVSSVTITPFSAVHLTGTTATSTLSPAVTTIYQVVANGVCGNVDAIQLTVQIAGPASFTLSGATICRGDSALVSLVGFASAQISPSTSVSWFSSSLAHLHPDTTTFYQLTGQQLCGGSYSRQFSLGVSDPAVTISATTYSICTGDSIRLTATAGLESYYWSSGQTASFIYINRAGNYSVGVTDSIGCMAQSDTVSIIVFPPPRDSITANRTIFCADDSARICAPAGFTSYQWNVAVTGNCIYARQAGNYYLTVTDANGCTAESNHISIRVYPVPSVSIIRNGDTLSSFGAVNYQWYLDGNAIYNATDPVYIAMQQGVYTVAITDTNGCISSSNPIVLTSLPVLEEQRVLLYPNPATDQLAITSVNFAPEWIAVWDLNGKKISEERYQPHINIGSLASGVYFIEVKSPDVILRKKFIKL